MIGKNITLRAVEPEDVEVIYQWENDSSVWHLSHTISPISRFDVEQYVMNVDKDIFSAKELRLMIINKVTNSAVGTIDIFDFNPIHHRAGLGILIREDERRKGFASETLDLVLDYCFDKLELHQLYANIIPDNFKSRQLFESKNFKQIANKKEWLFINNKWTDELLYQLIKTSR